MVFSDSVCSGSIASEDESAFQHDGSDFVRVDGEKPSWKRFVREEIKGWFNVRTTSFLLLASLALILSVALLTTSMAIETEFSHYFTSCADQIAEHFHSQIHDQLLALDTFATATTSFTLHSGQSWPQVTIPDFAIRAWTTRQQMKAHTLGLAPVVSSKDRRDWESYVVNNHSWIQEAQAWEAEKERNEASTVRGLHEDTFREAEDFFEAQGRQLGQKIDFSMGIAGSIYVIDEQGKQVVDEGLGPYSPIWMTSPTPQVEKMINYNLLSHHLFWKVIETCIDSRMAAFSQVLNLELNRAHKNLAGHSPNTVDPISAMVYPIFDTFEKQNTLVGVLAAEVTWTSFLASSLPDSVGSIVCVIVTACDQQFSYIVEGDQAIFLGSGDYHDSKFDRLVQSRRGSHLLEMPPNFAGVQLELEHCPFLLQMYPSVTMYTQYSNGGKPLFACAIVGLFSTGLAILLFFSRNLCERTTTKILEIPTTIGGKNTSRSIFYFLRSIRKEPRFKGATAPPHFKATLRALPDRITLSKYTRSHQCNTTLMVAEINDLITWSANKDPEEVMNLTETVFRSLNVLAKRHGVHQIEMLNGSYVAAVSSDSSDYEHATLLVYFACVCRKRMSEFFKGMNARHLNMRFGIHSGLVHPRSLGDRVTEYDQFHLFGETLDTARQLLEAGKANRIHISLETAELLNLAGKSHWTSARSDPSYVDGKGKVTTYWIKPKVCLCTPREQMIPNADGASISSDGSLSTFYMSDWEESSCPLSADETTLNIQRLIDQNTAILISYLRAIYAKRMVSKQLDRSNGLPSWEEEPEIGVSIMEEAREVISMPTFDVRLAGNDVDQRLVEVPAEVEQELRLYVSSIASAYHRTNAFHTFEHASHAVRMMDHMIKKMNSTSDVLVAGFDGKPRSAGEIAKEIDQKTFSIGSDPLVQFALIFAALVHDVDHVGVSNQQLIKERSPIATLYKNRSVSEQNAVDISWWLLMTSDFDALRCAIYTDVSEMRRFRQCLVNGVIATDILDRNFKDHRDNNWNKTFVRNTTFLDWDEKRDLQATLVVEIMMQVADAAHYLFAFDSYLKWNERLFEEMNHAYHVGRADIDPTTQWYKAELAFFDKFLIPLLTRIKTSGVFGGYGEVYLTRAVENRNVWKEKGQTIVREMVERFSRRVVALQEDTVSFT